MNIQSFRKTLIAIGVAAALGTSAVAQSTESSQSETSSESSSVAAVDTESSMDTATPEGIQPANSYLSSDLIGAKVKQPGEGD